MISGFRATALASVLILAGAFAALAEDSSQTKPPASSPPTPAETIDTGQLMVPGPLKEMTLGDPAAPVTVVEYASMTCPHCARFANETFAAFKTKYVDTGKAFFIFREFPLDQLALVASIAARCAPEEKYFAIIEKLFAEQKDWAFVENPGPPLIARLEEQGLTKDKFNACIADGKLVENIVAIEKRASETFGVNGTPTFFFNGRRKVGEMTIEQVDAIMEPLLTTSE